MMRNKFFNTKLHHAIFVFICACLFSKVSVAEPHIAQRYGLKCSACHTNVTGGGKRNAAGVGYALALTGSPLTSKFSPQLNEAISIGANFRADWTYTQFDDPEANTQGVIGDELDDTSAFSISNGTTYFEFALSDKLSFYLDQQVAPEGGRTREAVALIKDAIVKNSTIKIGKLYLPFGLRLQDDDAFIREITGFNFDNSDIGAEFIYEKGSVSAAFALTNGTQGAGENNTDKQFSSVLSFVRPKYRLGASLAKNNAPNGFSQEIYGVFGGLTLGKWVFLAEANTSTASSSLNEDVNSVIAYASADYLVTTSTNIKLSYDYFDPSDDIDEDERTRISLLGETFLNQYSQFRYGLRRYDGIPQNTFQNQSALFAEYHVFF